MRTPPGHFTRKKGQGGVPDSGVRPKARGQEARNAHEASGVSTAVLTAGLGWPGLAHNEAGRKQREDRAGGFALGGGSAQKIQKKGSKRSAAESQGKLICIQLTGKEGRREGGEGVGDALKDFPRTS